MMHHAPLPKNAYSPRSSFVPTIPCLGNFLFSSQVNSYSLFKTQLHHPLCRSFPDLLLPCTSSCHWIHCTAVLYLHVCLPYHPMTSGKCVDPDSQDWLSWQSFPSTLKSRKVTQEYLSKALNGVTWWECKMVQLLWKKAWCLPQKLNTELITT